MVMQLSNLSLYFTYYEWQGLCILKGWDDLFYFVWNELRDIRIYFITSLNNLNTSWEPKWALKQIQ